MTVNYANIQSNFGDHFVRNSPQSIPLHRFRDICNLFRIQNDGFRVRSLADADRVQESLAFIEGRFGPEDATCQ